jgi:uncharacterized RDD family membrane protein YckC
MIKYANTGRRTIAALFDFALCYALVLLTMLRPILLLIHNINEPSSSEIVKLTLSMLLFGGLSFIIIILYYIGIPSIFNGQTIGMKFFGLRIVKGNGDKVDFGTLFVREFFGHILLFVTTFGLSIFASFYSLVGRRDKRTFTDILSGTTIIDVDEED